MRAVALLLVASSASVAAQPLDPCMQAYNAELERRFTGNPLDPAQQALRREEEARLQGELNECGRGERPVGK